MSANLVVDIGTTTQHQNSISPANGVGSSPASGTIIGAIVDLLHANTFCNLVVAGGPSSGAFRVGVQVSDGTTSGSFVDVTSGLAAGTFPTAFISGGLMTCNSGLWASGWTTTPGAVVDSAPLFCSGGVQYGGFVRNARYARAIVLSGATYAAPVTVGFVSQLKVTGSGAGFTFAPGSGTVSV